MPAPTPTPTPALAPTPARIPSLTPAPAAEMGRAERGQIGKKTGDEGGPASGAIDEIAHKPKTTMVASTAATCLNTPAVLKPNAPIPAPALIPTSTPAPVPTAARTPSPTLTTTTDPSNAVTTGSTTVVMLATAERHNTNQHEREGPEVKRMEEGDKGGERREEDEGLRNEEVKQETTKEVRTADNK
jgi:hypothetical protein